MHKSLSSLFLLLLHALFLPRLQAQCPFTVTITPSSPQVCAGGCVTLTANVSGGVSPYTYNWQQSATTASYQVCAAGTYSVIVTDAMGCAVTASYTFNPLPPITAIQYVQQVTCFGNCNGSISLNNVAGGGSSTYGYVWNTGATTSFITGLCPGYYDCTVTAYPSGCTAVFGNTLNQPTQLSASVTAVNASCGTACNGSATVAGMGGTAGYTYLWSTGAWTNTISNLCPGTYAVTVTDVQGCTAVQSVTVSGGTAFGVNVTATPGTQICPGSSSVQLNTVPTGGTPGYTYQWTPTAGLSNPNIANPVASPTSATTYTCTVTDANGCQGSGSIGITLNTLCSAPSFRYTSNITQTSARFNWGQAACASQFQVRYRRANTTTYTTATVAGSQSSYTAAALLNNTSYRWSMRTQCTGGAWSLWSPELSFSTPLILNPARQDPDADVPVYDAPETGLYPNPAQHSVTLRWHLENPASVHIRLYDLTGRSLRDLHMQGNAGQNEWELSLEAVPTGLYWMELSSGESRELLRLAVER